MFFHMVLTLLLITIKCSFRGLEGSYTAFFTIFQGSENDSPDAGRKLSLPCVWLKKPHF